MFVCVSSLSLLIFAPAFSIPNPSFPRSPVLWVLGGKAGILILMWLLTESQWLRTRRRRVQFQVAKDKSRKGV